jgi:hypothetical protein
MEERPPGQVTDQGAKKIAILKLSATATDEEGQLSQDQESPRIMQDEAKLQNPHARKLWPTMGVRGVLAGQWWVRRLVDGWSYASNNKNCEEGVK